MGPCVRVCIPAVLDPIIYAKRIPRREIVLYASIELNKELLSVLIQLLSCLETTSGFTDGTTFHRGTEASEDPQYLAPDENTYTSQTDNPPVEWL